MEKKAILVVSYGTAHMEAGKKTLDVWERELLEAYPDFLIYRAWSSKIILQKIQNQTAMFIPDIDAAMKQMMAEGVGELLVQPTYLLNGRENEQMKKDVSSYGEYFSRIVFADPLITTREDGRQVLAAVMADFSLDGDEALVWVGHGTTHLANHIYADCDALLKEFGYTHVFVRTMEIQSAREDLLEQLKSHSLHHIILAPFMIVAGEHARNQLFGSTSDSWRIQLEQAGFSVKCVEKGLGEYVGVRQIYRQHIKEAIKELRRK